MKQVHMEISGVPAVLYGEPAQSVWLFIHGKQGCKEEAADFAPLVCPRGAQVLAVDLPCHGERKTRSEELYPWTAVPELEALMAYARESWAHINLRANSIGAWFSMLAFVSTPPEKSLLVSPILDMEELIGNMLRWAGVTEEELRLRGVIPTDFGETLEWRYLCYAREHKIARAPGQTAILYAGRDDLTSRDTVKSFASRLSCKLTVMENGEHWFHTPEQLSFMNAWIEENC